jgi:MFS family permease
MEEKIRTQMIVISAIVFIIMLGVGIVAPILPIYAESFSNSYIIAGLVISVFGLARLLFDIPSGALSDTFGRRLTIIGGIIVFAIGGLFSGLAIDLYTLLLARFVQGLGASIYTTSTMAYIADIVPAASRGRYLAYYQGSFALGVAVGPALGGFLVIPELGGVRGPFFILSATAFVSAIFAFLNLKSNVKVNEQPRIHNNSLSSTALKMIGNRSVLIINLGTIVSFISISGIRGTAIPFFGIGHLGLNEAQVGIVLGVAAIVNFLFVRNSGSLVDKLGSKRIIIYGFFFTGLSLLLFAYAWDFQSLIAIAALFGLSTSLAMASITTSAIEISDPSRRGLSMGIYRIFSDIGIISGPILVGLLLEGYGFSFPFLGVAILSFVVGILAATVMNGKSDHRE